MSLPRPTSTAEPGARAPEGPLAGDPGTSGAPGEPEPQLRGGLRILPLGQRRYVVVDPESGERFRCGSEERVLLDLLDGRHDRDEIRRDYRRRSGAELRDRALREFLEQLAGAGLLLLPGAEEPRPAGAAGALVATAPPPLPLTRSDPGARTNTAFDVLVLLFGWIFHPVSILASAALAVCALAVVANHFDDILLHLELLLRTEPIWVVIPFWIAAYALVLSLPREIFKGMACRRFGGRVRSLRHHRLGGVIPVFDCDLGDSVATMTPRGRWTTIAADLYGHVLMGSFVVLGWALAPASSGIQRACALLVLPWLLAALFQLVPWNRRVGYRVLCSLLDEPNLHARARRAARAWLGMRVAPEPLRGGERLWLRLYGLGQIAWTAALGSLLVVGGFWWLHARHGVGGVVAGALVLGMASRSAVGGFLSRLPGLRWALRHGGLRWLRWTTRGLLLLLLLGVGLLPYDREVSGRTRVVPAAEHGVRAQVTAEIQSIAVTHGDGVEAGQVVAELSDRDLRAAREAAAAELAEAQAQLDLLHAGAREEEVAVARQQVELWRLRVSHDDRTLEKLQRLLAEGVTASEEVRQAEQQRDTNQQLYLSAVQNYERVAGGARTEEIDAAVARLESARVRLEHARAQEELLTLRTPVAGRVVTTNLEQRVGQMAMAGDLIVVVQDTSRLRVEVAADEEAAALVEPGMPADVRLVGLEGELIRGRVQEVAAVTTSEREFWTESVRTDRETFLERNLGIRADDHRVRVIVALDEPPARLVSGMTGYARIRVGGDRLWRALVRPVVRFARTELWSWLP